MTVPAWGAAARRCVMRLVMFAALVSTLPFSAGAQDTGWEITSFDAVYTVNRDRTIDVVETIAVDFKRLQRHGIYREIPVRYNRVARADVGSGVNIPAGRVKVDLTLMSVTDERGNPLGTQVTRGDRVRIRIGDADIWVTGKQTYVIRYQLEDGGIGFFDAHDELYWQVTGTEWPVPILAASAKVLLPNSGDASDTAFTAWCYAGWSESSSNARCTAAVDPNIEHTFSAGRLEPGEGLTLVAGFPKGIVPAPTAAEVTQKRVALWWPAGLPVVVFLGMWWLWYTRGRDPHVGSIVPQWKVPDDLRPGTAGTLRDQSADMDDIIATLLDLAVRGYITIREVKPEGIGSSLDPDSFIAKALRSIGVGKTDWAIDRTKQSDKDLLPFEREVLSGVLEGSSTRRMSDLHNDFYKHLSGIKTKLYEQVVAQGWFARSPQSVRVLWAVLGVLIIPVGIGAGAVLGNVVLIVGAVLSGIIVLSFAHSMPAMTAQGARRYAVVKGLEEYIQRAEKWELEMTQAPRRTTELFSKLLPYAVAVNATDIWVDQFAAALASQPPTWYVGHYPGHFDVVGFQSGLGDFQSAASKTMGSAPGSSSGGGGGGSVGGGGGGGGGGSW